jgi:peptidoglycan-associated lipoprotein
MSVTKNLKKFGALAVLAVLAACASTPDETVGEQVISAPVAPTATPQPVGPAPGSQADLEKNAGHRVFFGYDEYTLTASGQDVLKRQAAWLKEYPETRIRVAGNCDERGTRDYNLALGARRANAVKAFLASQGVDPSRITTISYGKERPIDTRSVAEAWAKNRNATTTLVTTGS